MARRRTNTDTDTAQGFLAVLVLGAILGWYEAARSFVVERLPLFVALGVALAVLGVLVLRRQRAHARERQARQTALDAQVASTDGMTGKEFEELVARLLVRDGFTDVRIPGGRGDLGADVLATSRDGRRVVVQCKRYSEKARVGSPAMQTFLGTCFDEHGADDAWFVTTTRFSAEARDLGVRRGVTLVDRAALAVWMLGAVVPTAVNS